MKSILTFLCICFLLVLDTNAYAETISYEITDTLFVGKNVTRVERDSKDTLWMIISGGLYKSYNDSLYHFTKQNSTLTSDKIKAIAIDSKDTIWMITEKGLVKFDHTNFTTYDTTNTTIPPYNYHELAIDKDDNIWFSSSMAWGGGVIKYDKKEWHVYTPENSSLPAPYINSIAVDSKNNVWIACQGKSSYINNIVKIDGDEWSIYNEGNTGIPMYYFAFNNTLTIDRSDNIIVKIDYTISSSHQLGRTSLIKYNGSDWAIIDTLSSIRDWPSTIGYDIDNNLWSVNSNSTINYYNGKRWIYWGTTGNGINTIITGINNNIWFGTTKGIYVLESKISTKNSISQPDKINIYPNPTAQYITIDSDQFKMCKIYNSMGYLLATFDQQSIDLSDYENGIYLLNVLDKKGNSILSKIILNK